MAPVGRGRRACRGRHRVGGAAPDRDQSTCDRAILASRIGQAPRRKRRSHRTAGSWPSCGPRGSIRSLGEPGWLEVYESHARQPPLDSPSAFSVPSASGDGAEIWFSPTEARGRTHRRSRHERKPRCSCRCSAGSPGRSSAKIRNSGVVSGRHAARLFHERQWRSLFVADRTGADAADLSQSTKGMHSHNPVWSPDGRWIYFVHGWM